MVAVRLESPEDVQAIYQMNLAAFGRTAEADLVQELRKSTKPFFSFVAEQNHEVVGQVAYSPVTIGDVHRGLGLAPMGLIPSLQRCGIGTALINGSLQSLREKGVTGSLFWVIRPTIPDSAFALHTNLPSPLISTSVLRWSPCNWSQNVLCPRPSSCRLGCF
jgi:hypothetical protein